MSVVHFGAAAVEFGLQGVLPGSHRWSLTQAASHELTKALPISAGAWANARGRTCRGRRSAKT